MIFHNNFGVLANAKHLTDFIGSPSPREFGRFRVAISSSVARPPLPKNRGTLDEVAMIYRPNFRGEGESAFQ